MHAARWILLASLCILWFAQIAAGGKKNNEEIIVINNTGGGGCGGGAKTIVKTDGGGKKKKKGGGHKIILMAGGGGKCGEKHHHHTKVVHVPVPVPVPVHHHTTHEHQDHWGHSEHHDDHWAAATNSDQKPIKNRELVSASTVQEVPGGLLAHQQQQQQHAQYMQQLQQQQASVIAPRMSLLHGLISSAASHNNSSTNTRSGTNETQAGTENVDNSGTILVPPIAQYMHNSPIGMPLQAMLLEHIAQDQLAQQQQYQVQIAQQQHLAEHERQLAQQQQAQMFEAQQFQQHMQAQQMQQQQHAQQPVSGQSASQAALFGQPSQIMSFEAQIGHQITHDSPLASQLPIPLPGQVISAPVFEPIQQDNTQGNDASQQNMPSELEIVPYEMQQAYAREQASRDQHSSQGQSYGSHTSMPSNESQGKSKDYQMENYNKGTSMDKVEGY